MALVTEILTREGLLEPYIYLYKEGIFWKAYQYSAYRVLQRRSGFKLKKKFIKAVSCEVVSLGFPDTTLEHIFKKEELHINEDGKIINIPSEPITPEAYKTWFDSVSITDIEPANSFIDSRLKQIPTNQESVIRKIREFRIEESTPMDCMYFLASVRKELIG